MSPDRAAAHRPALERLRGVERNADLLSGFLMGTKALLPRACQRWSSMQVTCMAHTTITVSVETHQLLKKARLEGESFDAVIRRYVRPPAKTAGELLERLNQMEPLGPIDEVVEEKVQR